MSFSPDQIKWTVFVSLLLVFPAWFFLLFETPLWPVFAILVRVLIGILNGQFWIILIVYCVAWAFIYFHISKYIANKIGSTKKEMRVALVGTALILIALLGYAPIFSLGGDRYGSAYDVYIQLWKIYAHHGFIQNS